MAEPPVLKVCEHQVGGHMTKENKSDTLVDEQGRFYKPFQGDARNQREAAFYVLMYGLHGKDTPSSSINPPVPGEAESVIGAWGQGEMYGPGQGGPVRTEDIDGLRKFIPGFYGVTQVDGRQYMIMEDVCKPYKQPCVLDAKIGMTTAYAWADDKYKDKCNTKDKNTTQTACGFRISGLQVFRTKENEMMKVDRQWGRNLKKEDIESPFTLFASNGAIPAKDLYLSAHGVMPQLKAIRDWFASQQSFCFFQASVLFTYEGTATRVEDANVQVHLIDFAHTFPTGGKPDDNFLQGLDSLILILQRLAEK